MAKFVGLKTGADFRSDKTWRAMLMVAVRSDRPGHEDEIIEVEFMTTATFPDEATCAVVCEDVSTALVGEMPQVRLQDLMIRRTIVS